MGRLDNKVAEITGAGRGMGRTTAVRFAGEGAAVVVADLNEEGGASTVRQCKENGGRAVFQRADVVAEADIEALIRRAVSEFGRLDITFNNAGLIGAVGSLEEITAESWDRTHAILLRGVFFGIKYSIPEMRKAGGGSIISTASIAGMQGGFGPTIYSAAKAGVINLTHCAAVELGKDRIRVNCICPGGINTPIGGATTERSVKALAQAQPIRRAGQPEDTPIWRCSSPATNRSGSRERQCWLTAASWRGLSRLATFRPRNGVDRPYSLAPLSSCADAH